jgi:hypothetical protein
MTAGQAVAPAFHGAHEPLREIGKERIQIVVGQGNTSMSMTGSAKPQPTTMSPRSCISAKRWVWA